MFIYLDTETTGSGTTDRICQIAFKTDDGTTVDELFNPNMPISVEAMSIHHITNEMVAGKPLFKGQAIGEDPVVEMIKISSSAVLVPRMPFGNPDRGHANLRKNNKFILVQKGEEGIPTTSKNIHKVRLIKNASHIVMFIDDRRIIDWTDDGKTYGSVHIDGKIGFRQMQWTHFRYRNFKIWSILFESNDN